MLPLPPRALIALPAVEEVNDEYYWHNPRNRGSLVRVSDVSCVNGFGYFDAANIRMFIKVINDDGHPCS